MNWPIVLVKSHRSVLTTMAIRIKKDEDKCVIEIYRPEKANALNGSMTDAIAEAVIQNKSSTLIITGTLEYFCNGMDLEYLKQAIIHRGTIDNPLQKLRRVFDAVQQHPRTIAYVNGNAAGGGVGIALLCKYVVAYKNVIFRVPGKHVRKFTPIILPVLSYRNKDHGISVGDDITAIEALNLGLIDKVVADPHIDHKDLILQLDEHLENSHGHNVDLLHRELDGAFAKAARPEAAEAFIAVR